MSMCRGISIIAVIQAIVVICSGNNCIVRFKNGRMIHEGDCETADADQIFGDLKATVDGRKSQLCKDENGVLYGDKCYFAPELPSKYSLYYNDAVTKCKNMSSDVAVLNSLDHQKAIQDYIRPRIILPRQHAYLWLGMTWNSSGGTLRSSSGNEVSVGQFKWRHGYPAGVGDEIAILVRNDGAVEDEGLYNYSGEHILQAVICKKLL